MKQQEVFNRIGGIIKELNDQFKYLQDDPTKINELELELFVANAHFLANHAEVLKKLNVHEQPALPPVAKVSSPSAESPALTATAKEEKYFEPVVQKASVEDTPVPHIDLSSEAPEDNYSYIRQSEPEIIKHELEIDDSWVDDEDEEEVVEIPEPEPVPPIPEKPIDITPIPPLVVEKPASQPEKKEEPETLTINQRMSAQMTNKHETAVQPVSDLKSAITLNDKLLFVKDLFNGYSLAYSEAIDILNKFSSFDEADKYLKSNYATKNNWDSKPETSEKFYILLHRRFA